MLIINTKTTTTEDPSLPPYIWATPTQHSTLILTQKLLSKDPKDSDVSGGRGGQTSLAEQMTRLEEPLNIHTRIKTVLWGGRKP